MTPEGYKPLSSPRTHGRRGGGIAVISRTELKAEIVDAGQCRSYEYLEVLVPGGSRTTRTLLIYRPQRDANDKVVPMKDFFSDFQTHMEKVILSSGHLIISGDFNIHVNKPLDPETIKFNDILNSLGLKQHISQPTHKDGNTLDLLITRVDDDILDGEPVVMDMISDHAAIHFGINLTVPVTKHQTVTFRKINKIDIASFKNDLKDTFIDHADQVDLCDLVDQYNENIRKLLDKHAPKQTKRLPARQSQPWYNTEIRKETTKRRKLERKWRKTKLCVDYQNFTKQRNKVNEMLKDAKRSYYSKQIYEHKDDQKGLFKMIKNILHENNETPLPESPSLQQLANDFGDFFCQKIELIRNSFDDVIQPEDTDCTASQVPKLSEFEPVTEEDIRKIITLAPTKSCDIDPLPTKLLKECLEELCPVITKIINLSLSMGIFPTQFKSAILTPLLKKLGLELIFKNYRPVSNLAFISKLDERVVAKQLVSHMITNNQYDPLQSAYRNHHSTETAILKVHNDILESMDKRNVVFLVLLDLSAAFDTVDHNILLNRLKYRIGVDGTVLKWMESYLSDRSQSVQIKDVRSDSKTLKWGVPQGSVLGPILFSIYTSPLGDIVKKHGLEYHLYADDTQLYLAFNPNDKQSEEEALSKLELCVKDIRVWMLQNKLKLNDDKTEFLILGKKAHRSKITTESVQIGETSAQPTEHVRNLGVIFDSEMKLDKHVQAKVRAAYFHLRRIASIREYITQDQAEILVHAFITSRLDYCNSILYGVNSYLLDKLQHVQNAAARLITRTRKYDHITPVLRNLHWLPIRKRIDFKILLLVFKALQQKAPKYIQDLISWYKPSKNLRSSNDMRLETMKSNLVTCGDRAFSIAAPKLWNDLPTDIKTSKTISTFKSKLKTYLFQ